MTFTEEQLSDEANIIFDDITEKLGENWITDKSTDDEIREYTKNWIKSIPQGVIGAW